MDIPSNGEAEEIKKKPVTWGVVLVALMVAGLVIENGFSIYDRITSARSGDAAAIVAQVEAHQDSLVANLRAEEKGDVAGITSKYDTLQVDRQNKLQQFTEHDDQQDRRLDRLEDEQRATEKTINEMNSTLLVIKNTVERIDKKVP